MAGYVVVGALAAFGLLCTLWLVYGLFCGKSGGVLLIFQCGEFGILRRCLWLREMGLLNCSVAVSDQGLSPGEKNWLERHGIEIWDTARLGRMFGIGAEENGAGTGDPPGRSQRCGLSEL